MSSNKVKLLSNYQLFQLSQNDSLDQETLTKVQNEFRVRNVSILELKQLQKQHEASFKKSKQKLDNTSWDPFYTAFAWKRHLKQIALIKTQGTTPQVKKYQFRFYFGICIYMLLFIVLVFLCANRF